MYDDDDISKSLYGIIKIFYKKNQHFLFEYKSREKYINSVNFLTYEYLHFHNNRKIRNFRCSAQMNQ